MRKQILFFAIAALALFSSNAYAQKFGTINFQELIMSMPERDSAEVKLKAYTDELSAQLESISVEFNNKLQDYQKNVATLSDAVKQLKEKELNDLRTRYTEFEEVAGQDIQKQQNQLLAPVLERAREAIKKVSKDGGYLIVFDESIGNMLYIDTANVTNILPMVKKELGIKDVAAATPAKPQPKK